MGVPAERAVALPRLRVALPLPKSRPPTQQHKKPSGYMEGFLLKGTVFTEQGFSLPEAELRIRRASEKKVRWSVRTDRRGEFAIRVPKGAEYNISVRARGYQEQTRTVDAKAGEGDDVIIFRMSQIAGGKSK
ncbi:MAG TPA: carboxypeptidase-like regulatory domain-containing protein [Candidatus Dormibacteraeota bacterium]|nr:carboxypeptidase-like regulatory domain-containing protein [Candidatus Dormibacteraeota bacterium]